MKASFIIAEGTRACKPFIGVENIEDGIETVRDVECPDKKQAFVNISLS